MEEGRSGVTSHLPTFNDADDFVHVFVLDVSSAEGLPANVEVSQPSQDYVSNDFLSVVTWHRFATFTGS